MIYNRPKLIILIGPPGSGKSTYAKSRYSFYKYLSSDEIREELFNDVNNQENNDLVFYTMRTRAVQYLNQGYNVVYDATNMSRKDRKDILKECPAFVYKVARVIWAPIEECYKRNRQRDRVVPEEVIDKMFKKFQAPYYDEGFDEIEVTMNTDPFNAEEYKNELLEKCNMDQENHHHTLSLIDHLDAAANFIFGKYRDKDTFEFENEYDYYIYLAAKYHDIGKVFTKTFKNGRGEDTEEAHYYGHQGYSAWMCYPLVYLWNYEKVEVPWLISNHMDPYLNTKYYQKMPDYLKKRIDKLHEADVAAH